jgi:hypothetical protein
MLEVSEHTPIPEIAFEAYGVQVAAFATTDEILTRMEPLLPPRRRPLAGAPDGRRLGIVEEPDGTYSVYNAGTRVSEGSGLDLALVVVEGQIRSWVAVSAPDTIFVHAGVVAIDGRALVIPGESFSGKTTLVAALVRQGAVYYSDEFAVVDEDGLVHPYPKHLSIRPPGTTGQQIEHPVESFGGVAGDEAIPIGLAVVTYFVPGAEWRPRRLSPGEGALALLSRTVPARDRPEESLRVLTKALKGTAVLEGERGEADQFAELLLSEAFADGAAA